MTVEELLALEVGGTSNRAREGFINRIANWKNIEQARLRDEGTMECDCGCEEEESQDDHRDDCQRGQTTREARHKIAMLDQAVDKIWRYAENHAKFSELKKDLGTRGWVLFPNQDGVVKEIRLDAIANDSKVLVLYANDKTEFVSWKSILSAFISKDLSDGSCSFCGIKHTQYGMEAEIHALYGDNTYRDSMLRKLNRKLHLEKQSDKFGVDGSGEPLEIRNINGDTISRVVGSYSLTLDKLMDGFKFMTKNFPYVDKEIHTQNCGIHIHQFHQKIPRDKLATAHSLVGMLVNSLEPQNWGSRTMNGYGLPMSHRMPTPWCDSPDHATELRVFNVLHPKTLRCTLELTDEIAKKKFVGFTNNDLQYFVTSKRINIRNVAQPDVFNKVLSFFVEREVVTPEEIKATYKRIKDAYVPFLSSKNKERMRGIGLDEKIIGFKPSRKKPEPTAGLIMKYETPEIDVLHAPYRMQEEAR